MVCSDVLEPITPASNSGFKYIVIFILMKSRYVTVNSLRRKSEVMIALTRCYRDMRTTSGTNIKVFRSDNGGEYRNTAMDSFCKAKHIKKVFTVSFNPEQNGMAERMNRSLVEMTRFMLNVAVLTRSINARP